MQSKAETVAKYLAELPEPRRAVICAVRDVILANLDADIEERMGYGMISYEVRQRDSNHPLPYAALAAQKNHFALYLMCLYAKSGNFGEWFHAEWSKTGKKMDMGKSCIRFKKLDDLPLPLIGKAFKRMTAKTYLRYYETAKASKDAAC